MFLDNIELLESVLCPKVAIEKMFQMTTDVSSIYMNVPCKSRQENSTSTFKEDDDAAV